VQSPWSVPSLSNHIVEAVRNARENDAPFHHLRLERVFPDDFYAGMLRTMPDERDYRRMSGRSKIASSPTDGKPTRTKIDLFPEYIRHLPSEKLRVWKMVGQILCAPILADAFRARLGPGLRRRFGDNFDSVAMYPLPSLTRDIPGYRIYPHTDTLWKGITVQLYLPPDDSVSHVGTIFHESLPNGQQPKKTQIPFAPNTGYAFAVTDNSWHSADPVGSEVTTRDSILLTYLVDRGTLRFFRNRVRRASNFLLNELRSVMRH
jgi:hypothetical protein